MKVLVIAAHPDDEVLGCGGTIAQLAAECQEIHIAIIAEGITSRYMKREEADEKLLKQLHNQSRQAAKILGVSQVSFHGLPDNRMDRLELLDVVKTIESVIKKEKPDVVYTHHGGDLNIDHALIFRATLTATRPMVGDSVKSLYAYEVASSTEWAFQQFSPSFQPNLFVDIESTLEKKIAAMEVYSSEARTFPHPRSPESLRSQARRWGSVVGLRAAEAFQVVREIR